MQKLVKRTAEAQRAAARRTKKKNLEQFQESKLRRRQQLKQTTQEIAGDLKAARVARSEQWEKGAIAPRRDLDGSRTFAAIESQRLSTSVALKRWQIEKRCEWAGGAKHLNIVSGDRVVVLEGPDQGKIGRISDINMDTATVTLGDTAKHLSRVPDLYRKIEPETPATMAVPTPIPINAVRLVHPVTDQETGVTRDVIIRQLHAGPVKYHRPTNFSTWTRYVTGDNIIIPWPEKTPVEYDNKASDTVRRDVEDPTFIPTLLQPPMPHKIIDELRNRYSKFRTRHEEEYVMRKEAQEQAKQAAKEEAANMLTPVQEYNRKMRDIRRSKGQPMLTAEMLENIGKVIAKNKVESLTNAGLSEVSPTDRVSPPQ